MTDTTMTSAALRQGYDASLAGDAAGRHGVSAVSWAAIFAGAAGAAALSLLLLILGTGLGLSSVSPFSGEGASAVTFGVSTIAWLTFTQLAASGIGGYLAGRLRTRWIDTHVDEVYFRDTAHGFLAWAIATLVTAAMLTSVIGSIVGGTAKTGATLAGGAAATATAAVPAAAGMMRDNGASPMGGSSMGSGSGSGYFVDTLFRKDAAAASAGASAPATAGGTATPMSGDDTGRSTAEAGRIFVNGLQNGALPDSDMHYLGQLVAQRTGLSQADAEKRVTDTFNAMKAKADQAQAAAREAAEKARKASAYAALWLFVSLLVGAFVASLSATFGGRQRDTV